MGCAGSPAPVAEASAELEVRVGGIESDSGEVVFALFDSEDAFRARRGPVAKGRRPIADAECLWRVEGLAPGEYGLMLYHDLDGDGELDRGALGIPSEPYGFSNNARASFGPPPYERAKFMVSERGAAIEVMLK